MARPGATAPAGRMAQRFALCLALVACLLHTSAAFDWQPCSDSSKTADISEVSLTPEEPAAGDTVKFVVDGTASARQLLTICECTLCPACCQRSSQTSLMASTNNLCACLAEVDVAAGSLDIAVMYSGLPIYSETRDLCDMATCPIKTGPLQINFDQYLPPIVSVVAEQAADTQMPSCPDCSDCPSLQQLVSLQACVIWCRNILLQVPPGPYNVTLDAKTDNGAELLCLQVFFDVTPLMATTAAAALEHKAAALLRGHKTQA